MDSVIGESSGYPITKKFLQEMQKAFLIYKDIKSIILPETIEEIKSSAFWGCEGLISINFPESLIKIGDAAFYGCKRLISNILTINKAYLFDELGNFLCERENMNLGYISNYYSLNIKDNYHFFVGLISNDYFYLYLVEYLEY